MRRDRICVRTTIAHGVKLMVPLIFDDKYLEEVGCNLFGSSRRALFRERLDERVGYRFKNNRCLDCGLVYVSPRLRQEWRSTFNSWDVICDRGLEYDAQASYHILTAQRRLQRVERYLGGPGKIMDVGCATGYFLDTARKRGWLVSGVEVDPKPATQASERCGLPVTIGSLEAARCQDSYFDCVHMNDVIEHLPDPVGTLREARRILKQSGVLFVGTHNLESLRSRLDGNQWRDLGGLDHLFCFSAKTLRIMLKEADFEIQATTSGDILKIADKAELGKPGMLRYAFYRLVSVFRTATRLGSEIQFYATPR